MSEQAPTWLTLTEENWRDEIGRSRLKPNTQRLFIAAIDAWRLRKNVSRYPQVDPEVFENIIIYEKIDDLMLGKRRLVMELKIHNNDRHLCLRRARKQKAKS